MDKHSLEAELAENAWGEEEMRALLSHVGTYGLSRWDQLAETIPNKSADACRLKAENILDPSRWALRGSEADGQGGGALLDRITERAMKILDNCFDEVADRVAVRVVDMVADRLGDILAERMQWQ